MNCALASLVKRPPRRNSSSNEPASTTRPASNTRMRVALRMVARRCAITKVVRFFITSSSAASTLDSVAVSSALVASSRIRIGGSFSSARAFDRRWRSPPDSERQRLSIARALLKDPPILILDEATSALDAVTEAKVNAALDEVMKGRTTFVIAHRLSTIRNATRILVFDAGRVIESGTFDELVAKGGRFAELAKAQFMVQENVRASVQTRETDGAAVKI